MPVSLLRMLTFLPWCPARFGGRHSTSLLNSLLLAGPPRPVQVRVGYVLPTRTILESGITNPRVPSSAFLAGTKALTITNSRKNASISFGFAWVCQKLPMISASRPVPGRNETAKSGRTRWRPTPALLRVASQLHPLSARRGRAHSPPIEPQIAFPDYPVPRYP